MTAKRAVPWCHHQPQPAEKGGAFSCTIKGLADFSHQALALGAEEIHQQAWGLYAIALEGCCLELAALALG